MKKFAPVYKFGRKSNANSNKIEKIEDQKKQVIYCGFSKK